MALYCKEGVHCWQQSSLTTYPKFFELELAVNSSFSAIVVIKSRLFASVLLNLTLKMCLLVHSNLILGYDAADCLFTEGSRKEGLAAFSGIIRELIR